jgi:superfamily II DNA or RNA helicase
VSALVQAEQRKASTLAFSPSVDWLDVLPPHADSLRPYQLAQVATVARAMHAKYRRPLVQLPTGAGKTHIIPVIAAAAVVADLRVLILATRTRLVRQLHERLAAFEIRHGVVAAALPELLRGRTGRGAKNSALHSGCSRARIRRSLSFTTDSRGGLPPP